MWENYPTGKAFDQQGLGATGKVLLSPPPMRGLPVAPQFNVKPATRHSQ